MSCEIYFFLSWRCRRLSRVVWQLTSKSILMSTNGWFHSLICVMWCEWVHNSFSVEWWKTFILTIVSFSLSGSIFVNVWNEKRQKLNVFSSPPGETGRIFVVWAPYDSMIKRIFICVYLAKKNSLMLLLLVIFTSFDVVCCTSRAHNFPPNFSQLEFFFRKNGSFSFSWYQHSTSSSFYPLTSIRAAVYIIINEHEKMGK